MKRIRRGRLFVVSAPSGAGKTTLCNAVRRYFPDMAYSISYTTRAPRPGERHGVDYFFVSTSDFEQGIADGRWAEWARVHGNFYGTSARWIADTLDGNGSILMDIDVQGALQIVRQFPDAVTIFISPPSLAVLEQRLRRRATDDDTTIVTRLANARQEMARQSAYRYTVVNDDLERAKRELIDIIQKEKQD